MSKQWFSGVGKSKRRGKQHRAVGPPDEEKVALWLSLVLVALLSIIFLVALERQDMELMTQVLPILIIALKFALQRAFKKG